MEDKTPIKARLVQGLAGLILGALGASALRADGIALSYDGVTWLEGVGHYGKGWGDGGRGITVRAGATFYIKYYTESRDSLSLYFAVHGADWGSWNKIGPTAPGKHIPIAGNPIILKCQNVGLPKSTVTWVNGNGVWGGLQFPGAYDLALNGNTMWRRPPISISAEPSPWAAFWHTFDSAPGPAGQGGNSVADSGETGVLLALALAGLAAALAFRNRRRLPSRRHGNSGNNDTAHPHPRG